MRIQTKITDLTDEDLDGLKSTMGPAILGYMLVQAGLCISLKGSSMTFAHDPLKEPVRGIEKLDPDSNEIMEEDYGWNYGHRIQVLEKKDLFLIAQKIKRGIEAKNPIYGSHQDLFIINDTIEEPMAIVVYREVNPNREAGLIKSFRVTGYSDLGFALAKAFVLLNKELKQNLLASIHKLIPVPEPSSELHEIIAAQKIETEETKKTMERMRALLG